MRRALTCLGILTILLAVVPQDPSFAADPTFTKHTATETITRYYKDVCGPSIPRICEWLEIEGDYFFEWKNTLFSGDKTFSADYTLVSPIIYSTKGPNGCKARTNGKTIDCSSGVTSFTMELIVGI